MLNDKGAATRRELKDLLEEVSEPIPTAGTTIKIANSIIILGANPGETKELAAMMQELAGQLAELRGLLRKRDKE
jgi:hypothetical protein